MLQCVVRNMKASAAGKTSAVSIRAFCAGPVAGDGAIMALIEPHREKKFRFRVRIELKVTQKDKRSLAFLPVLLGCGKIRTNRTTFDWITRDQKEILRVLSMIALYSKVKRRQIHIATKIIQTPIREFADLKRVARLADALSKFNVRSKNRRKNYAAMIQEHLSSND